MFQTALWTLRQRRYAALAALMVVVAMICVAAGTWQISRFEQSVHDNDALTENAKAGPVPLTTALVPIAGVGAAPGRDAIRYRTVTTSGSYGAQSQFLRNQTQNGINGYYVVNPLRTTTGVVLVVRGFVAADDNGNPPSAVAAPPGGVVTVSGRLQTGSTSNDRAADLGGSQLEAINPLEQSARLGAPVYNGYLVLAAGAAGGAGLSVLPDPSLSNPAGGAYEWQHFAYIIQWYLFALLALAAPFAIGRSEVRAARKQFLGLDPADEEFALEPGLPSQRPEIGTGSDASAALARRDDAAIAALHGRTPEQWQHAARLADRYGRSLGVDAGSATKRLRPRRVVAAEAAESYPLASSATRPARSIDEHHGAYNDYLWELALADGTAPPVNVEPEPPTNPPGSGADD